jgi:YD repeat-containing protein
MIRVLLAPATASILGFLLSVVAQEVRADETLPGVIDGMPPVYRKVSLTGRPLPGPMPQNRPESDSEPENTFVDAMTLRFQHRTSDVYIPILEDGFALTVNRNAESSVWQSEQGLTPSMRPDLPFGNCWTSGLASNVHVIEPAGAGPLRVIVTDEEGTLHSFVCRRVHESQRRYVPLPTTLSQQEAAPGRLLADSSGRFEFTRKFGTRLLFRNEPSLTLDIPVDGELERHLFFRLESVANRAGTAVAYVYESGNDGLIPDELVHNEQRIRIELNSDRRVEMITEPGGGTLLFNYRRPMQEGGAPLLNELQRQITGSSRGTVHYEYEEHSEDTGVKSRTFHCNISAITDSVGNEYRFNYQSDSGRSESGSPRCVRSISLPRKLGVANFINYSKPALDAEESRRITFVADAEGNGIQYAFTGHRVHRVQDGETVLARVAMPAEQAMTYFAGHEHEFSEEEESVVATGGTKRIGSEKYEFDHGAGGALKSATDFTGNVIAFTHDEPFVRQWFGDSVKDPMAERHAEASTWRDAVGGVTRFTYAAPFRYREKIVDPSGRIRLIRYDGPLGLKTTERVYADAGALGCDEPFTRTDFEYSDKRFPGFVTKQIIRKTGASPEKLAWEQDLVTSYQCDVQGRTVRETVDPDGLDYSTEISYDANGNRRSVTYPNGYRIDFKYDGRHRLTGIFRGADRGTPTMQRMYFDGAGNKLREVEPDGTTSTYEYDGLNRAIRETKYPPGGFPKSPGKIFEWSYNTAGSTTKGYNEDGNRFIREVDALQRVTSIRFDDGSSTGFEYGKNSGSNLFDLSEFKATSSKRSGVSVATSLEYDANHRHLSTMEPSKNSVAKADLTVFGYDPGGNLVAETGPDGKRTEFEYDPLNRLIRTIHADGTEERIFYTSTGLKYATVDANGRRTEQKFDAAGEPVEETTNE